MPDRHCPKGAGAGSEDMLLPVCRYSSCMPGLCGGMLKEPAAERQRSGPLQPTVARERTIARATATDGVEWRASGKIARLLLRCTLLLPLG
jgi:hypothetical protein